MKKLADINPAAVRRLLRIALDDWECNNGRIINPKDPHWTVQARKVLGVKK